MKFAKYLQDTETPEWEKAYIDYSGLKAHLSAIRAKAPQQASTAPSFGDQNPHRPAPNDEEKYDNRKDPYLKRGNRISALMWRSSNQQPPLSLTLPGLPSRLAGLTPNTLSQQTHPQSPKSHRFPPVSPPLHDPRPPTSSPFRAMLSNLPANHTKFFDMLDAEFDKIETFYVQREEEMHERAKLLRKQLNELGKHRQLFYDASAHLKAQSWARRVYSSISSTFSSMTRWIPGRTTKSEGSPQTISNIISVSELGRGAMQGSGHKGLNDDNYGYQSKGRVTKRTEKFSGNAFSSEAADGFVGLPSKYPNGPKSLSFGATGHALDPREYQDAKWRLRKAVMEHHRGLGILNNYRTLNLAGFRKVLRKYGKITKVPVLDAYMKEKLEPSALASSAMVGTMLKEIEHLFAIRFEHGNKKKAINYLRVRPTPKAHHFSTFRSGLWLGLAVTATAGGCYLSFQRQTRNSLASWNILLFVYSILFLPIFLALLIGTNLVVWMRNRINYVFILKLNPRSRLDYREYFELPSFLFCTLACAFWFSLAGIGSPTLWPLAWLVLALVTMFNPIRSFMWGHTRWWTIRKIAKLGASGLWTVEFVDLWLGDQFCSLTYTLANLYFVGCFYTHSFVDNSTMKSVNGSSTPNNASRVFLPSAYDPHGQQAWTTCGVSQNWGWYYLLGVLPFLARFLQSLRRYWDSRLFTQLVNAGKYGVGIIQSFFYFYWRYHMSPHTGKSYILFCFASTVNSIYGCAWDFLVDWSMCKPYSRYPLLRPQLVYRSQVPVYYIAMLTNLCIRFAWLIYIYFDKGNIELYSFVAAMLEMLRRVQWNFFRVENKHVSNMELYRATRELPLPYHFETQSNDEEELAAHLRLRKRMVRLS